MGSVILKPEPHFSPEFLRAELLLAERYSEHHGGLLPNTPFWRYLEARSELDPARFRHWHPIVGRLISDDPGLHPTVPVLPTGPQQILPPPIGSQSVPEPSGGMMLGLSMVALALGLMIRRWRGL
jgi:hypothetical protein